jgi:hypothetical protein
MMSMRERARIRRDGVVVGVALVDEVSGVTIAQMGSCAWRDPEVTRAVARRVRRGRDEVGADEVVATAAKTAKKRAGLKALGRVWRLARRAAKTAADAYTGGAYSRLAAKAKAALVKKAPEGSELAKLAQLVE